ncbi:MAG: glycine cleavage system aminomethyltransferase GcvT [Acetobacteraceae bacterium]|nr:glycine cleavage system aminomethyltransferase GcvT [Acetobacteraceae bacterium]
MAEPVLNIESEPTDELRTVPLDALHRSLGAKMVGFAGYTLPVQYGPGVMAEHRHTRSKASLFDVSHMGQFSLHGGGAAAALEALVPSDIAGLAAGTQRYTVLLNEAGGIVDDLMVANYGDRLVVVANASRKEIDGHAIAAHLPDGVVLEQHPQRALLALQGPSAAAVMQALCPEAAALRFMGVVEASIDEAAVWISRSGYSGEDGFEISVREEAVEKLAQRLLAHPDVLPAGLGARDSLRLEAGLCLYGQDLDELTSPVEANLSWTVGKRRRSEANFLGAAPILDQLEHGPTRLRVGIRPAGRAPARAETPLLATDGTAAGSITSGGFSPTLEAPIAMGYVRRELAAAGTALGLMIRNEIHAGQVTALPFVPHRYAR